MNGPVLEDKEIIAKVKVYGEKKGIKFSQLSVGVNLLTTTWVYHFAGDFPNPKVKEDLVNHIKELIQEENKKYISPRNSADIYK